MLNQKSVTSSEPQIRSNPALKHVSASSGFQKRVSSLLEQNPPPFPTFQILREGSQTPLSQQSQYAWVRPAHLRSQQLLLEETMPLLMIDTRDASRISSLKIPFDKRRVQHTGPILLEGSWDAQDHILQIWDILHWEHANVWAGMPQSKRWEILKEIVGKILDCGHPMSDAEVRLPSWESLEDVAKRSDLDPAESIEFMPEKAGQRRHVFLIPNDSIKFVPKNHAERKMVSEPQKFHKPVLSERKKIVAEPKMDIPVSTEPAPTPMPSQEEKPTVGRLQKDKLSKLPDTQRLETVDGTSLGLPAVRSLPMSKALRLAFTEKESVLVDIQWFEPFQKYEIRKVHS